MATEPRSAPAAAPSLTVEYLDLPDLPETFADSIHSIFFDGQSVRITFCTTRFGEQKPNQPPSAKRYPCCRLVLSTGAALELINQMRNVGNAMTQAGIIKPSPAPPAP
jgi:hypothetical protein